MKTFRWLLFLIWMFSVLQPAQTYLNIKKNTGNNQSALLSKIRKLTFNETTAAVQLLFQSGVTVSNAFNSIQNFTFGNTATGDPIAVEHWLGERPRIMQLEQNYPNPFNPSTIISFSVPEKALVTLRVYDVLGNEIATLLNEERAAGQYTRQFDAHAVPSGVYFYKLSIGGTSISKKMIVLK